MHIASHHRCNTEIITNQELETGSTRSLSCLYISSLPTHYTGNGFRWIYCISLQLICTLFAQHVMSNDISPQNVICVSILICVTILSISVTTLWDMCICLCMWKGSTCHTNDLDSKPCWLAIDQLNIILPLTDKWERTIETGDKIL